MTTKTVKNKIIFIELEGATPLLCNRFTDEAAIAATTGISRGRPTETPLEIATSKLYFDDFGVPIIPQTNIWRSFVDAGKYHKSGKRQLTTEKSSILAAAASIEELLLPILHNQPWKVDTRAVRIPNGGRILTHRPCFDDWKLQLTVMLNESVVVENLFREVVDTAGALIGLGDFRPDRKGPYGRYRVTQWHVVQQGSHKNLTPSMDFDLNDEDDSVPLTELIAERVETIRSHAMPKDPQMFD